MLTIMAKQSLAGNIGNVTGVFSNKINIVNTNDLSAADDKGATALEMGGQNGEKRDKVSISEEARSLAANLMAANSSSDEKDDGRLKRILDMIKKIQEEIREIENSNLPREEKEKQLAAKRHQLTELLNALNKERQGAALDYRGGTEAQSFGSSLSG